MKKSTLVIVGLVMLVNSLSYGIIIPLLYPYATKFGLSATGLSTLFASFSLAQFIATPIIGRLSDTYGRKPLLLLCLFGTGISLGLFASAQSLAQLFVARVLDGITGGNNSVAQAIVADSTKGKERAKAFGMLGAAMGLGFVFGPAVGGLLSTISITAPFWFGAALAVISTVIGYFYLPETNKFTNTPPETTLFDPKSLWNALFTPVVGTILLISFIVTLASNGFFIGFQAHTVDVLQLDTFKIGLLFTLYGSISVIIQGFGLKYLEKIIPSQVKLVSITLVAAILAMLFLSSTTTYITFVIGIILYASFSNPILPVLTSMISVRTKEEDQGGILGINQAYASLGQIIGPLVAGLILPFSTHRVFQFTALLLFTSLIINYRIKPRGKKKLDL